MDKGNSTSINDNNSNRVLSNVVIAPKYRIIESLGRNICQKDIEVLFMTIKHHKVIEL